MYKMDLFNLLFIPMMLITSAVFGSVYVLGFHWNNPYKPSLIGSILLEEYFTSMEATESDGLTISWNAIL